ncbi:MAG TPA: substrate-binding domain-containing protein [Candidatus Cybelea sp.]|jgi:ABC-type phosphate transport system substrate-binding protein
MKKILSTLAMATLPALALNACSTSNTAQSSGMAALPSIAQHGGRVHRNDNGAGDLHGGGATFPAYGYNLGDQPTGMYTAAQPTPGPGSLLYNVAQKNGDGNNYYYCLTGSGFGRHEFYGTIDDGAAACAALGASPTGFGGRGDPVDWVGSDVALASTECCASGTPYATSYASTYGQPFEFPTFGGPIVIPYIDSNGQGLTGLGSNQLKLSTWTYCAISNGTIGYWDDGAITADNGGKAVAGHQPITFYYRSDGSGTTYLFENKLNDGKSGCNQTFKGKYAKSPYGGGGRNAAWPYGLPSLSTLTWTGPSGTQSSGSTFVGASGNPGIIGGIQSGTGSPYATGYAEGAWAKAASNPTLGQAALQSGTKFASPTSTKAVAEALAKATASQIQFGMGADGTSLGSSTPKCQLYMPPAAFVNPPAGAYPIVGLSYFMFYGKDQVRGGVSHYKDLKSLIQYIDSKTWNEALSPLEYSPLAKSTQKKIQKALGGGKKSCLKS